MSNTPLGDAFRQLDWDFHNRPNVIAVVIADNWFDGWINSLTPYELLTELVAAEDRAAEEEVRG